MLSAHLLEVGGQGVWQPPHIYGTMVGGGDQVPHVGGEAHRGGDLARFRLADGTAASRFD